MTDTQNRKLHPLLAAAAVAVILLSGVGIAKMLDWLPGSDPAAVAAEHQAEADRLAAEAKAAEEAARAEAEATAKAEAERVAAEKAAEAKVAAEKAEAARVAARKAAAAERAAAERQARASQGGSVQQVSTSAAQYASTCATCGVITNVS
ncbi:hypothetical protein, partial [Amnimonas aquatica]|uniref:hypothetical protein n=1 Tax=Amnimonas aquatica TaxID=2094561 RepID=UPI0019D02676